MVVAAPRAAAETKEELQQKLDATKQTFSLKTTAQEEAKKNEDLWQDKNSEAQTADENAYETLVNATVIAEEKEEETNTALGTLMEKKTAFANAASNEERLEQEISSAQREIATYRTQADSLNGEADELESQADELYLEAYESLNEDPCGYTAEELYNQADELLAEAEELRSEAEDASGDADELEASLGDKQAALDEAKTQKESAKEEMDDAQKEYDDAKVASSNARSIVPGLEAQYLEAGRRMDEAFRNYNFYCGQRMDLDEELDILKEMIAEYEEALKNYP
jgi:chromosome segregation ATPase